MRFAHSGLLDGSAPDAFPVAFDHEVRGFYPEGLQTSVVQRPRRFQAAGGVRVQVDYPSALAAMTDARCRAGSGMVQIKEGDVHGTRDGVHPVVIAGKCDRLVLIAQVFA